MVWSIQKEHHHTEPTLTERRHYQFGKCEEIRYNTLQVLQRRIILFVTIIHEQHLGNIAFDVDNLRAIKALVFDKTGHAQQTNTGLCFLQFIGIKGRIEFFEIVQVQLNIKSKIRYF